MPSIDKHYYRFVPEEKRIPVSERKFLKIVEQIRERRNDTVHGHLSNILPHEYVYEIGVFEGPISI
ncbi:protein of unknown function [Oenococcus oeni]|uniref:Uncharacterized protein n=1 Tax=Oenococcus oeni TaxID=1247 RepID=A0AAQ2UTQ9_OENOE|nr:hypothetical protein OENI_10020 [Oenococcus oeni]VDB98847.1 protein of unknown function [Oenococcus oeni]